MDARHAAVETRKAVAKKKSVAASGDSGAAAESPTFEEALASLEQIVSSLEGGQLGLGEALEAYEAGIGQLKACHRHLQAAERRVELLSGIDADGNPVTEPFDDAPMTLEQKQAARSRRRGAASDCDDSSVDDLPGLF